MLHVLFTLQVLGIYTYTKRVSLEEFELKQRKTQGYSTVSHFNTVHIECHLAAVRLVDGFCSLLKSGVLLLCKWRLCVCVLLLFLILPLYDMMHYFNTENITV